MGGPPSIRKVTDLSLFWRQNPPFSWLFEERRHLNTIANLEGIDQARPIQAG
jgi:hypothetical protein